MNWRYFSFDEFTCKCGCGDNLMDASFIDKLDDLRHNLGFPLIVSSGYRCPDYNDKISNTGRTGPHTTGRAVDLGAGHSYAIEILAMGYKAGFRGFGVSQKGKHRFIHLDDLPRSFLTIWSY